MKRGCRWLLLLIGIILLGLAFSSPLSPYAARSLKHGWQLGHILLFSIWTYLLFPFLSQRFPRPLSRIVIIVVATLFFGLTIEWLQTFVGRQFSLRDTVFDLNGSLLTLCALIASGVLILPKWPKRFLYSLTMLLSIYAIAPLPISLLDEINMFRNFPRLADFNNELEAGRWKGDVEIVELLSTQGKEKVLRIQLNTNHFSGVSLVHFPRDWRGYRHLQFELFNPERTPLTLTIRLHDALHYSLGKGDFHDRFNHILSINPGWNSVAVDLTDVASAPANRAMDMAKIQGLGLFSVDLPNTRFIYIDKLRLTP